MEKDIFIAVFTKDENGKIHFEYKNPLVLIIITLFLFFACSWAWLTVKWLSDRYYPYSGTVIDISEKWYDTMIMDSYYDEHLIILTPEGEIIDRYVDSFTRINHRIEKGDTVIKKKGFDQKPRSEGKKTLMNLLRNFKKNDDYFKSIFLLI